MAGKLGDLLVGEGDVDAAVAGRDDIGDLVECDPCLEQHVLHDLIGAAAVLGAGGADHVAAHHSLSVHHGRLGHRGADIDAGEKEF